MIETIMIFALGFLTAGLVALLIIPAVNVRAERLARRRIEAQFPLSISELTAEKDHLRAEFAVLQRRLERKAEEALAEKHNGMEELGRRAVRVEALETELTGRDHRLREIETELAETRSRLALSQDSLAAANAALAGARDTAAALEAAHRQTLDELASTRTLLNSTSTTLAEARTAAASLQEKLAMRESAHADLEGRHATILGELDAKRITVSDLETRLGTQTARGDEFERLSNERRAELSAERERLADLARNLVSEQERAFALEQRNRLLETEKNPNAVEAVASDERQLADGAQHQATSGDTKTVASQATMAEAAALKADKMSLEQALATARDDRTRLENELRAARRTAEKADAEMRVENAELRRRIDEVADDLLRFAESDWKGAAPVPAPAG